MSLLFSGLCIPWNTIETENPLPDTGIVVMEDTADQTAFHVIRKANEDNDDQQDLFTCPTDGCMKSFSKYKDLEMHVHVNDCKLVPEKACSTDRIKVMYVEKLQSCEVRNPPQLTGTEVEGEVQRSRGWALKKNREKTHFNKEQKDFLDSIFQKGASTGNKADPKDVSREMRHLKGPNGERHFTPKEFLTEQQITGYFSRMSQKRKPTFDEKSFESARHERAMEELNNTILKELA